jgi:putative tryptophan/tyrosine transport system substrate-binding protein
MERRGRRLSRRAFVVGATGLGLVAGCGRLLGQAETPPRVPRIGYLSFEDPNRPVTPFEQNFQDALRELGYTDGRNITIEWRHMAGQPERSPELAAELVRLPVEVIVASGNPLARDAALATSTIPIVLPLIADPVRAGTIERFARPGGNVTGVSMMAPEMHVKRLELPKTAVPSLTRLAVVRQVGDPANESVWATLPPAAQTLGVELHPVEIRNPDEFERVAEAVLEARPNGLMVSTGALITANLAPQIAEFTLGHRLPSVYPGRAAVALGGFMLYGPNTIAMHRRAAYFVDRILKGAKPADLPVEQPMTFEFVVNLKTARELGINFPQEIMLQVTEVIQ